MASLYLYLILIGWWRNNSMLFSHFYKQYTIKNCKKPEFPQLCVLMFQCLYNCISVITDSWFSSLDHSFHTNILHTISKIVCTVSYIYWLIYFKGALSCLKQFLATESPLKMMKNKFSFHLKRLFNVLNIFEFLSRSFRSRRRWLGTKAKVN